MNSLTLIGPGRHGTAIAMLFAAHDVDLTLYHHRPDKAERAAQVILAAAPTASVKIAESIEAAADASDVVALTTLWDAPQRQALGVIGDQLVGKILLDVSNPLDVTPTGIHLRKPAQGSAGQFVASLLPAGVGHVKVFSNLATAVLHTAADQEPPAVLPFLADSTATADRVRPLLERTGWAPRYVGGISRSAQLEIGGNYNRVTGRLGRTVLDEHEFTQRFGPEQLPQG